jgi:glycosyltransferase involved in cell wall biosynthesis
MRNTARFGLTPATTLCQNTAGDFTASQRTDFRRLRPGNRAARFTMNRLPISVCMVSGAEAHRIGQSLESIAPWAGEIVVVINADVADGTEEIARRFGARIFRQPWKGFIGQKNSAAEKATHPWILNLDADEVVSPALRDEIAATVSLPDAKTAYCFPRCTYYCGRWIRHGDWYPDRVTRLWRRGQAHWVGEEPHARLDVQGRVGRLRSDLEHRSNESIARQIAKIAPYHADFVRLRVQDGSPAGVFELAVRPAWRFLRAYVFRLGFLDGWPGFYIAGLSAFSTLTRYAMVREARLRPPEKP